MFRMCRDTRCQNHCGSGSVENNGSDCVFSVLSLEQGFSLRGFTSASICVLCSRRGWTRLIFASGPDLRAANGNQSCDRLDLLRLFRDPQRMAVEVASEDSWQERGEGCKVFVGHIEKPDLDERDYRILELKNGLKVVLVHDPLADKSAACLRVAIGSLCDPVRVFLCSSKHPRI